MALPEKRDQLNRTDEQVALNRLNEGEENFRSNRHQGHEFVMDVHPERYPRESLSRLEAGILDDHELRHADDHLSFAEPDLEARIENSRNLSRLLVVLGACLLIFAWVLLLWVGWDVRAGSAFFTTMCVVATGIGLGLIAWGYVERRRLVRMLERTRRISTRERSERIDRGQQLREIDPAA